MPSEADVDRIVVAVEKLTVDVPELKASIDTMGATLTAAQERTEEVDETARSSTRSLRRRWVLPLGVALVVVAVVAGLFAWQAHDTARRFSRTSQGLVASCTARQRSDAALRVKNQQLHDDTVALAQAFASSPAAAQLQPVLGYLNAEAAAYEEYLRSIPPPVDCMARYGR